MLIRYHGHSEFLLETEGGLRLLTDPFNEAVPYPCRETRADIVTVSHDHFDHSFLDKVKGSPRVLRGAGSHIPAPGIRVTGFPSFHDDRQGALRGPNTIFMIEAEGLRVVHLGDLGALPDGSVTEALRGADLLLLPVGGTYTLDAGQAAQYARLIAPRVVIPMHYRDGGRGFQNIQSIDTFLSAAEPLTPSRQPLLRVTGEDVAQAPRLVVLDVEQDASK